MVVSEMGEQWSPMTAPAQQAEMPMISSSLEAGKMAVTIGIRMPKVPQEVPEAKASTQATAKITAGSMAYRAAAAPSIRSWTYTLAPREVMVAFRETARVRIRMGEIMALKPLGTQAMASLKVTTRRATR